MAYPDDSTNPWLDDPDVLEFAGIPTQSTSQVDQWNAPPPAYNPAFANDQEVLQFAGIPTQHTSQVDKWNLDNPQPSPRLAEAAPDGVLSKVPGADPLIYGAMKTAASSQESADESGLRAMESDIAVRNEAYQKRRGELEAEKERKEQEAEWAKQDRMVIDQLREDISNEVDPSIDPNRYAANISSAGKIAAGVVSVLRGFFGMKGEGITEVIGKNIDRDIQLQKEDIANGQARRNNRLKVLMDKGLTAEQAENRLRVELSNVVDHLADVEEKELDVQAKQTTLPAVRAAAKAERDKGVIGYLQAQRATRAPAGKAKSAKERTDELELQDKQTWLKNNPGKGLADYDAYAAGAKTKAESDAKPESSKLSTQEEKARQDAQNRANIASRRLDTLKSNRVDIEAAIGADLGTGDWSPAAKKGRKLLDQMQTENYNDGGAEPNSKEAQEAKRNRGLPKDGGLFANESENIDAAIAATEQEAKAAQDEADSYLRGSRGVVGQPQGKTDAQKVKDALGFKPSK